MRRRWCASRAGTTPATRSSSSGVKTALQLIPSGIMRDGVACYIGNGVVVDPAHLLGEIERLEAIGLDVRSRLFISESCPLILPFHVEVDRAREALRETSGAGKIGTTGKGIGPAYEDKVARRALRVQDLKHPERFAQQAARAARAAQLRAGRLPRRHGRSSSSRSSSMAMKVGRAAAADDRRRRLRALQAHQRGANILFEGAQGTLLDIDHGTYPYVTSSNCVAGNAAAGSGVGPDQLHYILGITKAYTTRVGSGPFPTELPMDEPGTIGHHLSTVGQERGTVTGRRAPLRLARCGAAQALDHHQRHLGPVHHQARRARRAGRDQGLRRLRAAAASGSTSCRSTPTTSSPACRSTRPSPAGPRAPSASPSGSALPVNARRYLRAGAGVHRRADRHGLDRPRPRAHDPAAPPLPARSARLAGRRPSLIRPPATTRCSPTTANTSTSPGTSTTC